jgi:tetratricopeptide (TPR) repeat protein
MYSRLGDQPRAAASAERAIEMAEKAGDEVTSAKAHSVLALEGFWSGRTAEGIAHGAEAIRVLREYPDQGWYLGMAHVYVALNHMHAGRFEEALASAAQAEETGREMGDPRLPSYAGWVDGWVEASRGNVEAAIALCETSRDRAPDRVAHVYATMVLGYAVLEYGDPARARGLLEPVARELEGFGIPQFHGFATALTADALRIEGRLDEAAAAARAGLVVALGAQCWYVVGFARRVLGRVAHGAGRLETAAEELTEALQTFDRAGAAFEAGRTRLDLAAVARDRGDRDLAREELRAASAAFAELGTTVYAARAARLSEEPRAPATPPPDSSI